MVIKTITLKYKINDKYTNWVQNDMLNAIEILKYNRSVRWGKTSNEYIVGIILGTNCAALIADLFLNWYKQI